jgi:hypothetical protein
LAEVFLKYGNGAIEISIVLTPRHVTRFAVEAAGGVQGIKLRLIAGLTAPPRLGKQSLILGSLSPFS